MVRLTSLTLLLFLLASVAFAQVDSRNVVVSPDGLREAEVAGSGNDALKVICVDGTCAGGGGGTQDVNIVEVGGNALTDAVPITYNTRSTTGVVDSNGDTVVLALEGAPGASADFADFNDFDGTVRFEASFDGGVTYRQVQANTRVNWDTSNGAVADVQPSNHTWSFVLVGGETHVRVRVTSYTSGSADVIISATGTQSSPVQASTFSGGGGNRPIGAILVGGRADNGFTSARTPSVRGDDAGADDQGFVVRDMTATRRVGEAVTGAHDFGKVIGGADASNAFQVAEIRDTDPVSNDNGILVRTVGSVIVSPGSASATGTLDAFGEVVWLPLNGAQGASVQFTESSFNGVIAPVYANTTLTTPVVFGFGRLFQVQSGVISDGIGGGLEGIELWQYLLTGGETHVGLYVQSYTSGSMDVEIHANNRPTVFAANTAAPGQSVPLFTGVGGRNPDDGLLRPLTMRDDTPDSVDLGVVTRNIPSGTQTIAATDLDIRDLAFATDKVDVTSSTVTSNQGSPTTAVNRWPVQLTDGTDLAQVTGTSGGSLQVECTAGCGAPAAFADNSAFTFNTTSIANIGAVVDDVSTNTVAENSAGAPRMSGSRYLYTTPALDVAASGSAFTGVQTKGPFTVEQGYSTAAIQVTGTWSGTIVIERSLDGSNFEIVPASTGTDVVTSITTNGIYVFPIAAAQSIQFRSTAWTSGTATWTAAKSLGQQVIRLAGPLPTGTNSIGSVTANAGTNLNTSALLTTAAHDAAFGTAGSADSQVRSVQGVSGMTPVAIDFTPAASVSGTVTPGNAGTSHNVEGKTTAFISVTGTWSAVSGGSAISFEVSADGGTTWGSVPMLYLVQNPSTLELTFPFYTSAWAESNSAGLNGVYVTNVTGASLARVNWHTAGGGTGTFAYAITFGKVPESLVAKPVFIVGDSNDDPINTRIVPGTSSIAIAGALPAGTNNIGDVDIVSLPDEGQQTMANSISVAIASNQSNVPTNVAQIAGTTTATSNGGVSAGTQRVTIANDSTGILASVGSISTSVTPGTGAGNLGKAEDGGHTTADTGVFLLGVRNDGGSTAVTNANADYSQMSVDAYGAAYARVDNPNRIRCQISSTATTSTLVTGCSAPGAGLSIYLTSLQWSSSIISTTTNFMTVQAGTGGTCGTGTTVHYQGYALAFTSVTMVFQTPIKVAANSEVCFIHPGAGTRLVNIQGFIAP